MKICWCTNCLKWINMNEKASKKCDCGLTLKYKKGEFNVKAKHSHEFAYEKAKNWRGRPIYY